YEQFLGKTIRLTKAHHAKIEEKPEVRKAGGVYYTPKYIVDYIVKNTIGKLIEGKTLKQVEKIKICDPACGSGSFLIGAYQYLLNWHLKYYTENQPKKKKDNPLTPDDNLTTAEKKRILLNNIFGVDIDAQAVEVTKLNLLLKALEGETQASISKQLTFFNERVLPNLGDNIKCGNSLIGNDFYDNQLDLFPEQMKKINAFDWKEGFPEIFKYGGFDAVIGNPPYVMLQTLETRESFDYALKKYESAKYKIDTYQLFIELSVEILNDNGLMGFITPNTFLKNIHSEPLRNFLLQNTVLKEFMLFQYPVFSDASVDVCISIIQKNKNASKENELAITNVESPFDPQLLRTIKQSAFLKNNRLVFNISLSDSDNEITNKIKSKSNPLSTYCKAYFGIQTYDRKKYVSEKKLNRHYEPIVDGGNIHRFYLKEHTEYVSFVPEAIKSGGNESVYRQTRIGIRQIGHIPIATIIPANIFGLNTLYNVYKKNEPDCHINFLLASVNSKLNQFIWKKIHYDEKKIFPKIKKEAILSINIYNIDFLNPEEKKTYDFIIKLVENLLNLNKQLHNTKLETQRQQIQRTINHTEKKIDELVYGLYGLTEKEIRIVENG
ncbi:MAG: N-6 DNA methylase, partial [Nitrosopumilus sp.]